MTVYLRNRITRAEPCTITGEDGAALAEGDIVTGEDAVRAVAIENGLARVTYELPEGAEPAAHHLFIAHEGEWLRCLRPGYGDWSFWVTPISVAADRAVVIEANEDAVEVSFEWAAKSLDNAGYGFPGGLNSRDYARNLIYPSGSATPRQIATVHLRKVLRMERGVRGYWRSWRSDPNIVPQITAAGQAANNEKDLGERELGIGGGAAVVWASTGNIAYFPAWLEQRDWSAVVAALPSFDNFAFWPGIDDATYPPWNHATVIAMQPPGCPAEQAEGPFYVADIPKANYGGHPNICRYMVAKNPQEIGTWCYAGQLGETTNHLTNPWTERDGRLTRFPNFLGAEYYEPDDTAAAKAGYTGDVDYANEPSASIQSKIDLLATYLRWPE